jgi:3-hydroxyacyl-CoA dehydrogenase
MAIKKVAVIGAGVMGAGIAAQLANAGLEVELLDRVDPKNPADRDSISKGAIQKSLTVNPAAFMLPSYASRVHPGNTEDNLDRLGDCDLIIEAVYEDPKLKSDIFKKIDAHRKPGAIVASNTSTIPLKDLIADQSDTLKKDFMITHFFNPPRYMPLLELVTSEHNSPEAIAEVTRFMDEKMGKGVINCKDTPSFIGNRIGTYWIQTAINEAYNHGLTVEQADAIMGAPIGVPNTGVFGLADLVGLDIMPHITKSLNERLPANDDYVKGTIDHPVIDKMIADGFLGRKAKGGFYRRDANNQNFAVDLNTGELHPKTHPFMQAAENAKKGGFRALFETQDAGGEYAWDVLKKVLCYAAKHVHEVTDNVTGVDDAMKLGYNWKFGPFEMLDKIGVDYFISRLKAEGEEVPEFIQQAAGRTFYRVDGGHLQFLNKDGAYENVQRPTGVLLLSDVKLASKPVATNASASVWNVGDGVLCLEFHSKANALDPEIVAMINQACDLVEGSKGEYKALVIHNEGADFSAGANLSLLLAAAKKKDYAAIEGMVKAGQDALKRLKYASFPVVAAPTGKALGGGCEVLMNSRYVQAHSETYPGLVESGVGLLPGWGGSTELITRMLKLQKEGKMPQGPIPPLQKAFQTILLGQVGLSAFQAKELGLLRATDGVTMNKSRLLADAKAKALELAVDFKPELPVDLKVAGTSGHAAMDLGVDDFYLKGLATSYDVVVANEIARVLSGDKPGSASTTVSPDDLRALELASFMKLIKDDRTIARIENMLKTGKPLREAPVPGKTSAQLRAEAENAATAAAKAAFDAAADKKPAVNDNAIPVRKARKTHAPKP